jgi:hypothetical protein
LASVVLPAPFWPTIASDDPAGMVSSRRSRTGWPVAGYANVTSRKRISLRGAPATSPVPRGSAPAGAIASCRRVTAAAGAAAPSSAQDNPPKAIMLVPTAAVA